MSNFEIDSQEVILVPVDEDDHTLLFSDIKIENIDSGYRTVTDAKGLAWKLAPGEYRVKVFLRDLQMKTIPLKITNGVTVYHLFVHSGFTKEEPRVQAGKREEPYAPAEKEVKAAPIEVKAAPIKEEPKGKDQTERMRYQVSFPVSYRNNAGDWVKCNAVNLSTNGICIERPGSAVREEDNLYVRLHVPVASIPLECPARVVWVKVKDSAQPRMGLQLYLTANMKSSLDSWFALINKS